MSDGFEQGGPSAPFGGQHHDQSLPPSPSYSLPGDGDEKAMEDYIAGKEPFFQHPVGRVSGGQVDKNAGHRGGHEVSSTRSMEQHGVRTAKRAAEKKAKSLNPISDTSGKKLGY